MLLSTVLYRKSPKILAMETETTTLTVRINGTIETPPSENREQFRQSVIDAILHILKTQNVDIEYIGYRPDDKGMPGRNLTKTEYEDCIYASLSLNDPIFAQFDETHRQEDVVQAFIQAFENNTRRHIEIESNLEEKGSKQRTIQMSSDWKLT